MINANDIKQRSLIASHIRYEKELDIIGKAIKEAADKGEFMLYYNPNKLRMKATDCSGILNVLTNAGFTTGIKDNKLIISWFDNLKDIDLLKDYEHIEIN